MGASGSWKHEEVLRSVPAAVLPPDSDDIPFSGMAQKKRRLESPVTFGSPNDPVSVVLCLACTDSSSHMDKLSKVAEILMSENKIAQMKDAADIESILKLFEV